MTVVPRRRRRCRSCPLAELIDERAADVDVVVERLAAAHAEAEVEDRRSRSRACGAMNHRVSSAPPCWSNAARVGGRRAGGHGRRRGRRRRRGGPRRAGRGRRRRSCRASPSSRAAAGAAEGSAAGPVSMAKHGVAAASVATANAPGSSRPFARFVAVVASRPRSSPWCTPGAACPGWSHTLAADEIPPDARAVGRMRTWRYSPDAWPRRPRRRGHRHRGAPPALRDVYHLFLRVSWWWALA